MRNGCPKEEFDFLEVIGAGSFGSVHRAEEKSSHREVAIKIMKRKFESPTECDILLECKIIQLLPFHPNIVQTYDTFFSPTKELYFVMEYMNGGNLFQLINHKRDTDTYFTPKELRNIMQQTLAAVSHIHLNQIFHRDLKPENLLLTMSPNGLPVVKLADFGLARETSSSPPYTEYVSTRWYRAPEVLLRSSNYCCAVDLWAVGTIFAELITRQPLFPGESEIDQLYCICKVLGSPGNKVLALATKKKNLRAEKKASPGFARRKTIDESTNESNFPLQRKASTASTISVLDGGGEWREGVKLAHRIGFEFPHLRPQPLDTVIPQATPNMLDLLRQFLYFNPQSRLKASDALQHLFFSEIDQDEQTDDLKTNDMEIINNNTTTAPVNIPPPLPNIQTSVSSSHSQISPSYSSIETMSTIIEDHNEPSDIISSHVTITQINTELLNENLIMSEIHHLPSKETSLLFNNNNNNHHSSTSTGKRRQPSVDLADESKLRKRDIDVQQQFDDDDDSNRMDLDEHIHTHRQLMDHSFDTNNNNNNNEILNESNTIATESPTHPHHQDDTSSTSSKNGNISGERYNN
ncbi:unnamed protein product [Cunninghamella blakesleeana]